MTSTINTTTGPSMQSDNASTYATGLAGVDISVDDTSSNTLYMTIMIIFFIVACVRLTQMGRAHIRHVTNMGSSSRHQNYWSQDQGYFWPAVKKHLLIAPLYKKRHNREVQLSMAVNVGTLPSRLHTLLLMGYLVSNVVYCTLLDYTEKPQVALVAEIRGRTGHLSIINMVVLFVLAGRNNPLIFLLGISFDTFNLFHRWIGRIAVLEAIVHTVAWSINEHAANGWQGIHDAVQSSQFIQYGLVGTVALSAIFLHAPSPIRHAFYETFLHIHQFLAALVLYSVLAHAKLGNLPQTPYVVAIILIWSYDRTFRLLRLFYRNVSLKKGITKVMVEALPGEACRVTFFLPRPSTYSPGAHAYIYLPGISLWMSHPFSIAWSSTTATRSITTAEEKLPVTNSDLVLPPRTVDSLSFIMSKRTGMTSKLYERAAASPHRTMNITGFLEGPYGTSSSLHSYGTVLLFAGGVGITHQIGYIRALIQAYHDGITATRKITLVWTVRTTEQLEWVRPWMDEVLALPGRREVLNLLLFVTKPKSAHEVRSGSEMVKMFPGRPKPYWLVKDVWDSRVGAMTVGVCGPGALADDVRAAVRQLPDGGVVDFWEEAFTW
ncbi:hypothetical protein MMC19_003805 [Ptychographa xylographoides]|nr:hypothetical protein [Ptychographa xylographoides]